METAPLDGSQGPSNVVYNQGENLNCLAIKRSTWGRRCLGFCGILVCRGLSAQTTNALPPEIFQIPDFSYWNTDVTLRGSLGYRDNPTLSGASSTNAQTSAFWSAGGDVLVFRLPVNGWQFNAFASYSYLNYVSLGGASSASDEQDGMAMAQLSKELGGDWKTGVSFSSMLQDQVVDTTITQTNGSSITEIKGENVTGRWFVRKSFKPYWTELSLSTTRQWLALPLYGFWQPGARLAAGRDYGHGSALSLTYQWAYVDFDTREQVVATNGAAIAGTHLRFQSQSAELAWQQAWNDNKKWQTVTKAGLDINQDNGSGYFDFWQYHLAEQLKYKVRTWDWAATTALNYYDFTVQPASLTDLSLRRKTTISAGLTAGKKLGKSFKIFASATYERSLSNTDYDAYETATVTAGVEYHF